MALKDRSSFSGGGVTAPNLNGSIRALTNVSNMLDSEQKRLVLEQAQKDKLAQQSIDNKRADDIMKLRQATDARQATKFNNEQSDRAVTGAFNKIVSAGSNVIDFNRGDVLSKVDEMSLTPEEMKYTDGLDITNSNSVGVLAKRGASPEVIQSILSKGKLQAGLSTGYDKYASNPLNNESRYEVALRALRTASKGVDVVPADLIAKVDGLKAAEVIARQNKASNITKQIDAVTKALTKNEAAQHKESIRGGKSTGGRKGDKSFDPKVTRSDYLTELAGKVSLVGGAKVGDADDVYKSSEVLDKLDMSEGEKRFILNSLKENGTLGNAYPTPGTDEWTKGVDEARRIYTDYYGTKGSGKSTGYTGDFYGSKITGNKNQLAELAKQLGQVSKSRNAVRDDYVKNMLAGLDGTVEVPGGDGEKKRTGDFTTKLTDALHKVYKSKGESAGLENIYNVDKEKTQRAQNDVFNGLLNQVDVPPTNKYSDTLASMFRGKSTPPKLRDVPPAVDSSAELLQSLQSTPIKTKPVEELNKLTPAQRQKLYYDTIIAVSKLKGK